MSKHQYMMIAFKEESVFTSNILLEIMVMNHIGFLRQSKKKIVFKVEPF